MLFSLRHPDRSLSVSLFILPQLASAVRLVTNSSIPANLTQSCATALLNDVNCSPVLTALRIGSYYPESTLNSTCTPQCTAALSSFQSAVVQACGEETWLGFEDTVMPLVVIPDILRYLYNLTCLMDTGRYCNTVAAKAAFAQDPGSGDAVTGDSIGDGNSTAPTAPVNQCDLCFIKNLQFRAGSPYYDGPLLIDSSVYQSKTSSCSITGYPLTTSVLGYATPTLATTPTPTACSGKTYAIQGGDDCYSISKSQGIGTGWLLYDNDLQAYCSEFPKTGNLCLINTCKVYSVKQNDTCTSIAAAQNVTVSQIVGWNPVLDPSCYNMDKMNGSQICVSAPGKPYVTPTISLVAPTIATTPAPVPTDVADGVNTRCGRYYHVVTGDYCNMIVIKFKITMDDFIFLNPAINANCTNLFADESYCVQAVGDIDTYSGRAGYSTPAPTQGPITAHYTDLPDATYVSPSATATPTPYADGTRTDCNSYFNGDIFQGSIAGTNWKSNCELAAASYDVDLSDFGTWNTGLQYCGKLYFGDAPDSSPVGPDLPIRDGASPNCTEYADIDDGWTCADILDIYDLTIAQFFSYNSAVKADCSGLWLGYQYCIRAPGYSDPAGTTTTSAPGNPPPTPTGPVQPGQPSDCNKWYTIQSGDSCASVEQMYFITHAQFRAWNPSVSEDCSTGFWLGYDYCVSTTTMTTTRSSINPPPTSTSSAVPAPTPNQAGNAISNCNKYAQTQDGDYCSLFATRNGITTANLYAWNSVVGSDGSGCDTSFWLGYYYCVGVS
ncbi:MAG: hypothetical protein Q9203_001365 [Teloschistes exilis]